MARPHRFAESPVLQTKLPAWRSRLVLVFLVACFAALAGRAFYLQIINNDFLQEKGDSRYRRDLEVSASRGRVIDRSGDVLAVSTPMKSIWAIPSDVKLTPEQLQQLSKLLELDSRELNRKLATDKNFVYLQRQIPPDVAERVAALKLPGIHQNQEYRRYYPSGEMTAHMVGFTGIDDKGLEGAELAYQASLLGKPGSRSVIKDRRGNVVEDVGASRPPQDGRDVQLALDSKIQYLAYSQLKQAVLDNHAKAGGIIVLDAKSGEVLALANWPTYNPNNRARLTGAQIRNRAVTDTFEPGSTMKPFIVAMALEKGKFRYDSLINCNGGKLTIGSATIHDSHPNNMLTVAQVIQKSSNVGAAKISAAFPPREVWEMYDTIGLGHVPQLGFPGEVSGRLRPWKSWQPIEQATMAYGHGLSASLIQLVHAYTVFARDGEIIPLSLTKVNDGLVTGTRVFSPQTIHELRAMMELVVEPGGTAPQARVPGYRVGGKTGTAHKLEGGVYAKKYVSSFVGIGPMSEPRLIVAVMIDEPAGSHHYGGDVAGPVFSNVMGGALRTLGVPQDAPVKVAQGAAGKEAL
jgi:cell division protein FtsI (penicillin-binding protein 3)